MEEIREKNFTGWTLCATCKKMNHELELSRSLKVCPKCDTHFAMSVEERIKLLSDNESFVPLFETVVAKDILGFIDTKTYEERLQVLEEHKKTSAVKTGVCLLHGHKICLGVMDYLFMGGSLGQAEGEKITSLIEYATTYVLPLVIVSASGGARMQESIYSLMQMAKTSAALKRYHEKGGLYISVLTHPTMGGVLASFASLGDLLLAEKGALIGFAGPRVIEQTMKVKLKQGDQRSEFHLSNGMIDQIVNRKDLKQRIATFITVFTNKEKNESQSVC